MKPGLKCIDVFVSPRDGLHPLEVESTIATAHDVTPVIHDVSRTVGMHREDDRVVEVQFVKDCRHLVDVGVVDRLTRGVGRLGMDGDIERQRRWTRC